MTLSRFNSLLPKFPSVLCRSFTHMPPFGPPTQKVSQMFREIKEWQLAQILSQSDVKPCVVLAAHFCKEMVTLEKTSKMKLHTSITDRIWDTVCPKKLTLLTETYAHALQDTMLKTCSEDEIDNMLSSYDRKGSITQEQNARLRKIYKTNRRAIQTLLDAEADEIKSKWLPELMTAAEKEGIEFPKKA